VIVAGCPENIGLIVVTVDHLGAHGGREDAYRIVTLSGRPFAQLKHGKRLLKGDSNEAITDRYKLRPLVDPKVEDSVRAVEHLPAGLARTGHAKEAGHVQ